MSAHTQSKHADPDQGHALDTPVTSQATASPADQSPMSRRAWHWPSQTDASSGQTSGQLRAVNPAKAAGQAKLTIDPTQGVNKARPSTAVGKGTRGSIYISNLPGSPKTLGGVISSPTARHSNIIIDKHGTASADISAAVAAAKRTSMAGGCFDFV